LYPNSRVIILNRGEHGFIRERLAAAGLKDAEVDLITVTHDQVPFHMARMDAGVFFLKPAYSKQASAPTKLAEFLGCGIPCLSNEGVGDMAEVLKNEGVGVSLKSFDQASMISALDNLLQLAVDPNTKDRCVSVALRHFSLVEGVARYSRIYKSLNG
jgi:hypothetical protein